ncbi:MAG: hypothetical protein KKE02_08205 [Alphaproteobacteria bacterium]|nr:hypothetical protein [Alphaproteobacteria bacterium]MBU1514297.1 hypothetical protein [Alphaproteobacteria bacterium]MBU2095941.1 hypothetical protein [Alphaproteobacteria bacterium]MBU2150986.1 hypothetical protein [Alphaproteobacteria bacterium]MBU2308496.1 hypothetical protein [Alphaproteobacteria bacterium]
MRHLVLIVLAATAVAASGLSACQRNAAAPPDATTPVGDTPTPDQPNASTGAAGAVTGSADPNPTGAGAMTDAKSGASDDHMGSTPLTGPAPTTPPR